MTNITNDSTAGVDRKLSDMEPGAVGLGRG